jgi:hypothetical protein
MPDRLPLTRRTKVPTKAADAEKWLAADESLGVHRVLFYGDHLKGIERLVRLLGFETVRKA